jgi:hypothetical protein
MYTGKTSKMCNKSVHSNSSMESSKIDDNTDSAGAWKSIKKVINIMPVTMQVKESL